MGQLLYKIIKSYILLNNCIKSCYWSYLFNNKNNDLSLASKEINHNNLNIYTAPRTSLLINYKFCILLSSCYLYYVKILCTKLNTTKWKIISDNYLHYILLSTCGAIFCYLHYVLLYLLCDLLLHITIFY